MNYSEALPPVPLELDEMSPEELYKVTLASIHSSNAPTECIFGVFGFDAKTAFDCITIARKQESAAAESGDRAASIIWEREYRRLYTTIEGAWEANTTGYSMFRIHNPNPRCSLLAALIMARGKTIAEFESALKESALPAAPSPQMIGTLATN